MSRFWIWAVFAFAALGIAAFVLLTRAEAHSWYDGTCCNETDCYQTAKGEVERHDGGWMVVPTGELIPFDDKRIKRSLDPLIHRCAKADGSSRCLYVPEVSG